MRDAKLSYQTHEHKPIMKIWNNCKAMENVSKHIKYFYLHWSLFEECYHKCVHLITVPIHLSPVEYYLWILTRYQFIWKHLCSTSSRTSMLQAKARNECFPSSIATELLSITPHRTHYHCRHHDAKLFFSYQGSH